MPNNRRAFRGPGVQSGPAEKADNFWASIGRLFKFMGMYKLPMFIAMAFMLVGSIFFVLGPKRLGGATTELFSGLMRKMNGSGGIDIEAISHILAVVLIIYSAGAICTFISSFIMANVSQQVSFKIRREISDKLNRLPFSYFERSKKGDILSTITNDVDTLGQALNQSFSTVVSSITMMVGVVVMMFSINALLSIVAVAVIALSIVLIGVTVKLSQKDFILQQKYLGSLNSQVEENYSGHIVVSVFNRQKEAVEAFKEENGKLYQVAWKAQFISGLMQPAIKVLGNLAYVAVAVFGGYLAIGGAISIGDIQAFIQYIQNLNQPLNQISQIMNQLQQMAASSERVFKFLDAKEEPVEETDKSSETKLLASKDSGSVEFDHVSFGYNEGELTIKDFTYTAEPHSKVAIVGPTGAGKTTLVKLLMRFYDVTSGSIKIDGVDISRVNKRDIRKKFAMVLQDTWLFNGTVMENIRYGRLEATDEEVIEAAKAAHIHHFIEELPEGYNTVINEDASNLSVGEKQLLTIARAMVADRDMLILDEATSSVDTRTEVAIQTAMDKLMEGRTSFVIAHRLSTIKNADQIIVLNHGDIVEHGTHKELLALNGFYADLYNSQFDEAM